MCRTAPQCGFSHRVLTILNDAKVDYETVDVLDEQHNPGVREAIKEFRYEMQVNCYFSMCCDSLTTCLLNVLQ